METNNTDNFEIKLPKFVTSRELNILKDNCFKPINGRVINVANGVRVLARSVFEGKYDLDIYLGSDFYGGFKLDNFGSNGNEDKYRLILKCYNISHMFGMHDENYVSYHEIYGFDSEIVITEDVIKTMVIKQLKKKFPMFELIM